MTENKPIVFPAIIRKVETMSDGGLRLKVDTREMSPAESTLLFTAKGLEGFIAFKAGEILESELANLPDEVPEFKGEKTKSQRLRDVLYVLWKALGIQENFDSWRNMKMESVIEHFRNQIPT